MSEDNDIIVISDEDSSSSGSSSSDDDSNETLSSSDDISDSDDVQIIEDDSGKESDCECDIWDDGCVILKIEVDTPLIQGIHHMLCVSIPEELNDTKRVKFSIEMNERFNDEQFLITLKENYANGNAFESKDCELITKPWKALVLNQFLNEASSLEDIRQEFYKITWNLCAMDLFEFIQSDDLKNVHEEHLSMMYDFLKGEMMSWVAKLTGLELVHVSATCSLYSDTDFLLVHDDQQGTRAVAFVLYLTGKEGWLGDWGGCLQLLNCDENNQPLDVEKCIIPRNNQLVLFPISGKSYHQVEEVLCKNYCRMSINGWFHTKEALIFEAPLYVPPTDGLYSIHFNDPLDIDVQLAKYIETSYMSEQIIRGMQIYIEGQSEMSLEAYFTEQWAKLVLDDLPSKDLKWKRMGPSNRRNYQYISNDCEHLPVNVKTFIDLMHSRAFFEYLSKCTGLELKTMKWEFQKWSKGSYSLVTQDNVNRLDVMYCLGDVKNKVVGGITHYITLEDRVQTALISTECESNNLNLVFGDTARFTSLISKYSKTEEFYIFFACYYEAFPLQSIEDEEKKSNCSAD